MVNMRDAKRYQTGYIDGREGGVSGVGTHGVWFGDCEATRRK